MAIGLTGEPHSGLKKGWPNKIIHHNKIKIFNKKYDGPI